MSQSKTIRTYSNRKQSFNNCRFCAAKMEKKNLLNLTLEIYSSIYKKMISFLKLDVDLSENNKLPKAVCIECNKKCLECYKFFTTVLETQEKLSVLYNNKDNTVTGESGVEDGRKDLENDSLRLNDRNINNLINNDVAQTNENNSKNDNNIAQTCLDPLQIILKEDKDFIIAFPDMSNDMSNCLDTIQDINIESYVTIKNVDHIKTERYAQYNERNCQLGLDIGPSILNDSNFNHTACNDANVVHSMEYEEEMKPVIQDPLDSPALESSSQCKDKNNSVETDFDARDINIVEDIPVVPTFLENDNHLLSTSLQDGICMDLVPSTDQLQIKTEIDNDNESNIDNCNFGASSISETTYLNMLNERNETFKGLDTDRENYKDLMNRDVKTEINTEDGYENNHNFANEIDSTYNDKTNSCGSWKADDECNAKSYITIEETMVQSKLQHNDVDQTISATLQDRNLNIIKNSNQNEKNTVETDGNKGRDLIIHSRLITDGKTAHDVRPVTVNIKSNQNDVILFNNRISSELNKNRSKKIIGDKTSLLKRTFNNHKSRVTKPSNIIDDGKVTRFNNKNDTILLNNILSTLNPRRNSTKLSDGESSKNNMKLLNENLAYQDNPINIQEFDKDPEGQNQTLLNNIQLIDPEDVAVTKNSLLLQCSNVINEQENKEVASLTGTDSKSHEIKEVHRKENDNSFNEVENLTYDEEPIFRKQNAINSYAVKKSKITPWRFDEEDIAENDDTKNQLEKKYIYNNTVKKDIFKFTQHFVQITVDKEIASIDPDNEHLISWSWESYPWMCVDCRAVFETVEDLRGHRQYVHSQCSWFQCRDCNENIKLHRRFVKHVRSHRYYLRLFCEYCNQKFATETSCLSHAVWHQSPYRMCAHCGEEFPDVMALTEHRRLYNVNRSVREPVSAYQNNKELNIPGVVLKESDKTWKDYEWTCLLCSKVERDLQSLRAHARDVHQKCLAVKCGDCPRYVAQSLRMVTKHVITHRPYLSQYCYFCDKRFRNSADLTVHIGQHFWRGNHCKRCGESFTDKHSLREHINQFNPKLKQLKSIDDNSEQLLCHLCGKLFRATNEDFDDHLQNHERDSTNTCEICCKKFSSKKILHLHSKMHTNEPHTCDYCKIKLESKQAIKKHMLEHLHGYDCIVCKKKFLKKNNLTRHMLIHDTNLFRVNKDKIYICDNCGKVCKSLLGIKQHMIKHSGVKKELCKICNKRFLYKSCLKAHEKTHNSKYICEHCEQIFQTKSTIINHMKCHSDRKPQSCFVCGKSFNYKCNLIVHLKRHID